VKRLLVMKTAILVRAMVLVVLASGVAWSLLLQNLPLERAELGRPYPVVAAGRMEQGAKPLVLAVGLGGATAEVTPAGEFVVRGRGSRGRSWSFRTALAFGPALFHADLDRNGIPDLLITRATGGCGSAPSSHLIALLFDAEGLPVPFECDGFLEDGPGVSDLFDMDRDGKAVLVATHATAGSLWAWTLYKAENARWRRVDGVHGGHTFPLFTSRDATGPEAHRTVSPTRAARAGVPDLGTARPALTRATLLSYRLGQDDELDMRVRGADGRVRTCHPSRWHASYSLVLDTSAGRTIVQGSASRPAQREVLDAMRRAQGELELYGSRPHEGSPVLAPELIWARPGTGAR